MIPGVDLPAVVDLVSEPIGVDMGGLQADPPQGNALFVDSVFNTALDDGFKCMTLMKLLTNPKLHLPRQGWQLATLVIGSSCRSTSYACKRTSTRLR
jgi:hypothetical protein